MSFLLPHFLKEGRLDTYFTRVYNPLWTNPDGFTWMEVLQDESKIGLSRRADTDLERDRLVRRLRAANGPRHRTPRPHEPGDACRTMDRFPTAGSARRTGEAGEIADSTRESNPGEVWEETEFWIALSWAIDPDGALGSVDSSSPRTAPASGSPSTSITDGSSRTWFRVFRRRPLAESHAARIHAEVWGLRSRARIAFSKAHERPLGDDELAGVKDASRDVVTRDGATIGAVADGVARAGFSTPSRRLELYSDTLVRWDGPSTRSRATSNTFTGAI